MKRIGVLTSGGDTPGMNTAIRAVLKAALDRSYTVLGIRYGYKGLIEGAISQMQYPDVHSITGNGGTILRTARSDVFKTPMGQERAMQMIKAFNMDGLIVIGGDGSFRGAKVLAEKGVATIGIPGTIDNDLSYTDFTIGFDTAVNNVVNEMSKIRDTMRAHDRVAVVEVMGRACGDIALWSGIAGPADIILLPERPRDWADAANQLTENKLKGRLTSLVIIAEGAGHAEDFAEYVREHTDVEIRPVVLSYIQRGGSPSAFDRILATRMGVRAVELLAEGMGGRALGMKNNKIVDVDFDEATTNKDTFDDYLYGLNSILSKF